MKKLVMTLVMAMVMAGAVFADADATATACVAGADEAYADVIATVEAELTADSSPAALVIATETVVAAETSQALYVGTCDAMASYTSTPTETPTATNSPTVTSTSTKTSTRTVTPTVTLTSTPTPVIQSYRNERVQAFWYDITGNTTLAVAAYYNTASSTAQGRGMLKEVAWMIYDAGHVLIKKFNSETNWYQETKRIGLIKTPAAQATAKAIFVNATVTPVIYLLEEAEAHATVVAGLQQTPVANRIRLDINHIHAVETYVAE